MSNDCEPCKTCPQPAAYPYVGGLGITAYVLEAIAIIWFGWMFVNATSQDYRIYFGLLVGILLFDLLFWIINLFRGASCYVMKTLPSACNPCGCELIVKGDPCEYESRLIKDLYHANDQEHFQLTILGGAFVLFFFGLFVLTAGTGGFNFLVDPIFAVPVMNFVIAKGLQLMAIAAIANGFKRLCDTHSDLMRRHFSAINSNETQRSFDFVESSFGNKMPTKTNARNKLINGY